MALYAVAPVVGAVFGGLFGGKTKTIVQYREDPRTAQLEKELQKNTKELQTQISRGKELQSSLNQMQNQLNITEDNNNKLQQDLLCNNKLLEEAKTQIEKLRHESIENAINYGLISKELMKEFAKDARFEEELNFNKKKLNIAILGRVSSGKSTTLNAFLHLQGTEKAKTGHDETTRFPPQSFVYPNSNEKAIVWDFPGVGGVKSDWSKQENRKYIYLLSLMDVIIVLHDGVFDRTAQQTFNFVKEFPNHKFLLYNKIDSLTESMMEDQDLDDEQVCYNTFQNEGKLLLNVLNGHELFLVSARTAMKALQKSGVETYDWVSLVERLHCIVLEKFRSMDQH